jgi:hypothetical protein
VNSRCVAYLNSLTFQEGTPLAPAEEHTPTEVATTDSGLGTPDRQVFMAVGETPGPSGTRPDHYFEDVSADETTDDKNARRERNRKRNEWRRRLRESLPIRKLTESLDQVENRVHTTPE